MTANRLDGARLAEQIRNEIREQIDRRTQAGKKAPGLATVLVGENTASQAYVRSKHKASQEVGIRSFGHDLPATATQAEVEALVERLNADDNVHGILVQLPLPEGLNEEAVLSKIDLHKDVDGFHPVNIGRLAQKGRDPLFVSCTPAGVMELIAQAKPDLNGVNAVVLGRSNIVGMPVALLLVRANATVTICHSRTKDLARVCAGADVLVAAVGRTEMVRGDWIKPGAVVIDVGINRVDDPSRPRGYRLVGDVNYAEAEQVAGWLTPVPGGVGPMTIAMLLRNTLKAAEMADETDEG